MFGLREDNCTLELVLDPCCASVIAAWDTDTEPETIVDPDTAELDELPDPDDDDDESDDELADPHPTKVNIHAITPSIFKYFFTNAPLLFKFFTDKNILSFKNNTKKTNKKSFFKTYLGHTHFWVILNTEFLPYFFGPHILKYRVLCLNVYHLRI